jgi:hypothetical protein
MTQKTALVLPLFLALAGCSEELLRETSSPAYAAGYQDGCKNGSSTASNLTGAFIRDEARYKADPDYATGWRSGNRNCDGQSLEVNPNAPLEQIDVDGPVDY